MNKVKVSCISDQISAETEISWFWTPRTYYWHKSAVLISNDIFLLPFRYKAQQECKDKQKLFFFHIFLGKKSVYLMDFS